MLLTPEPTTTAQYHLQLMVMPTRIAKVLFGIALLLTGLSLLGLYIRLYTDYIGAHRYIRYAVDKINLETEQSIPTFYTVVLMVVSSVLLWLAYRLNLPTRSLRSRWLVLALVFVGLALDEATSIHELLNDYTPRIYQPTSIYLAWTWVLPYGLFSAVLFVVYIPFLRALPRRTAGLLMLAGGIYIGGAIGVEMIGSALFIVKGPLSLQYGLSVQVEEFLEMAGLIVFIYALTGYLLRQPLTIKVSQPTYEQPSIGEPRQFRRGR